MAHDPADLLHHQLTNGRTPRAPLSGTKSQSMQRLQVGLFGLAAMVLLVGLANIIMKNAQQTQAQVVPEAASAVAARDAEGPVRDPLADAGVVPDLPVQPRPSETPPSAGDAPSPQP